MPGELPCGQKNTGIPRPGLVPDPGRDVSDPGEGLANLCRKASDRAWCEGPAWGARGGEPTAGSRREPPCHRQESWQGACRGETWLQTVPVRSLHGLKINPYQRARARAVDSIVLVAGFHIFPRSLLTGAVRCVSTQSCLGTAAILSPRSHLVQFLFVCTISTGVSSHYQCHRLYPLNI